MTRIVNPFNFYQGDSPLLVSMPHSGLLLLDGMAQNLSEPAKSLPDTDWYIPELYDFLQDLNVSVLSANYSRYVIDLNRSIDDKPLYSTKTTGLFPDILFADLPVFKQGKGYNEIQKEQIKADVWQAYHQKISSELTRIKEKFGYAILFDAHSIAAQVPMLFDGVLPDFNFGNNDDASCAPKLLSQLENIVDKSQYSHVCNGRFKGGYITRFFGQPEQNIHAIQLELSQATYLIDDSKEYLLDKEKKQHVSPLLKKLIESLLTAGNPSISIKKSK